MAARIPSSGTGEVLPFTSVTSSSTAHSSSSLSTAVGAVAGSCLSATAVTDALRYREIRVRNILLSEEDAMKPVQMSGGFIGFMAKVAARVVRTSSKSLVDWKDPIIKKANENIGRNISDPYFMEFYQLVVSLITDNASAPLSVMFLDELRKRGVHLSDEDCNEDVIGAILQTNLAELFQRLAKALQDHKSLITNYSHQTSLTNLVALFNQKIIKELRVIAAQTELEKKMLSVIELEGRYAELRQNGYLKKDFDLNKLIPLDKESDEALKTRTDALFKDLFFDRKTKTSAERQKIDEFIKTCRAYQSTHQVLNRMTNIILNFFFPRGVEDIQIHSGVIKTVGGSFLYGKLKIFLRDFLMQSYISVFKDPIRSTEWERMICSKDRATPISILIQAPAEILTAFSKDYIQNNPNTLNFVNWGINLLQSGTPAATFTAATSSRTAIKEETRNLATFPFASWLLKSIQEIMQMPDNQIIADFFHDNIMKNLTLGLLAKGSVLLGDSSIATTGQDEFLKQVIEISIKKIQHIINTGNFPSKQAVREFLVDLPLPPFLQNIIVKLVWNQIEDNRRSTHYLRESIENSRSIYETSLKKISTYSNGAELISITDKLTDRIMGMVSNHVISLDERDLVTILDRLLIQYLPGLKLDEQLMRWLKANIRNLGLNSFHDSSNALTTLLRTSINAVLLKSLTNAIETTFKNDPKQFAAQLFHRLREGFGRAFAVLDVGTKESFQQASRLYIDLQHKIGQKKTLQSQLERSQIEFSTLINSFSEEERKLFQAFMGLGDKRALLGYRTEELRDKIRKRLMALNEATTLTWNEDKIKQFKEALDTQESDKTELDSIRRQSGGRFTDREVYEKQLKGLLDQWQSNVASRELIEKKMKSYELLIAVSSLRPVHIELIKELIAFDQRLSQFDGELNKINEQITKKNEELNKLVNDETLTLGHKGSLNKALECINNIHQWKQKLFICDAPIAALDKALDEQLSHFKELTKEFSKTLGLQKESAILDASLRDQIWPYVESMQNKQGARLLFEQLFPAITIYLEKDENARLLQIAAGGNFFAEFAKKTAEEAMEQIPEFLSFQPVVKEILTTLFPLYSLNDLSDLNRFITVKLFEIGTIHFNEIKLKDIKKLLQDKVRDPDGTIEALKNVVKASDGRTNSAFFLKEALKQHVKESESIPQKIEDIIHSYMDETQPHLDGTVEVSRNVVRLKENQETFTLRLKEMLNRHVKAGITPQEIEDIIQFINQLIITEGKVRLGLEDVVDTYQAFMKNKFLVEVRMTPEQIELLKTQQIVKKIQKVFAWTPEEVARKLNNLIPGASDLHTLMAPQLQAIISADDPEFVATRKNLKDYLEAFILKTCAHVLKVNTVTGKTPLNRMTEVLIELFNSPEITQTMDKITASNKFVEGFLSRILGITSKESLLGILPALQEAAYENMYAQLKMQLGPLIMPVLESEKNKEILRAATEGSTFLEDLCCKVSKEVIEASKRAVKNIDSEFAGKAPAAGGIPQLIVPYLNNMVESEGVVIVGRYIESILLKVLARVAEANKGNGNLLVCITGKLQSIFSSLDIQRMDNKEEAGKHAIDLILKDVLGIASKDSFQELPSEIREFIYDQLQEQLGTQLSPLLVPLFELERNKRSLQARGRGPLFIQFTDLMTKEVIKHLPDMANKIEDPKEEGLAQLIIPKLKAFFQVEGPARQIVEQGLQLSIEAVMIKIFSALDQQHDGANILNVITSKVLSLIAARDKSLTTQQAAVVVAEKLIQDILGIRSPRDLVWVPPFVRETVYRSISGPIAEGLAPFIIPLLEKENDRETLERLSGSPFLGRICQGMTVDAVSSIPTMIQNYDVLAKELFRVLSNKDGSEAEIQLLTREIHHLVEKEETGDRKKDTHIKNKHLLAAYKKIANISLDGRQEKQALEKIKAANIKQRLGYILKTPESIVDAIAASFPVFDDNIRQSCAKELHQFISSTTNHHHKIAQFTQEYLEGMLLKVFIRAAEKYPAVRNVKGHVVKDTADLLFEKLLDATSVSLPKIQAFLASKKQKLSQGISHDQIKQFDQKFHQEVGQLLFKEILNLDSKEDFKHLPPTLQMAADYLFNIQVAPDIGKRIVCSYERLNLLDGQHDEIIASKAHLQKLLGGSWADIIAEDVGRMAIDSSLDLLSQPVGSRVKGVAMLEEMTHGYVEGLARKRFHFAQVLLDYGHFGDDAIKNKVEQGLKNVTKDVKAKAAKLVSQALMQPLDRLLSEIMHTDTKRKERVNQEMVTNIMEAVAEHLTIVNQAKKKAKVAGKEEFSYPDFVKAAGDKLHPALPTTEISYQASIDAIEQKLAPRKLSQDQKKALKAIIVKLVAADESYTKPLRIESLMTELATAIGPLTEQEKENLLAVTPHSLKEVIRKEARTYRTQRIESFYGPKSKKLLKLLFPNARESLTFVAPELRGVVWGMVKEEFPAMLSTMVETLLSGDTVTTMMISSLETMRDNLREPIVLTEEPPVRPEDRLDRACGAVLTQLFDMTKLPDNLMKRFKDANGRISPAMQQSLGSTLRRVFNANFADEMVKKLFKNMATRDAKGQPKILHAPQTIKEQAATALSNENKLKDLTHEVVDAGISYFARNQWQQLKAGWDKRITNRCGNGRFAKALKLAVKGVFAFIEFVLIGSILKLTPNFFVNWMKKKLYAYIHLDENAKVLLDILRKNPSDQPHAANHVIYNENLIYGLWNSIEKAQAVS